MLYRPLGVVFKAIYDGLPHEERARLMEEARASTGDIFWDRPDNPESPASFALWDLMERDFGGVGET